MKTHINVTVDFSLWKANKVYDLRIPTHQPVQQLIINLAENLGLAAELVKHQCYAIKIVNKEIVLFDDDLLSEHHVSDGDVLVILN